VRAAGAPLPDGIKILDPNDPMFNNPAQRIIGPALPAAQLYKSTNFGHTPKSTAPAYYAAPPVYSVVAPAPVYSHAPPPAAYWLRCRTMGRDITTADTEESPIASLTCFVVGAWSE